MSDLILHIAKVGLEIGGWVARYSYLNWNIPKVGRIVRSIEYGPDPRHRLDVIVPEGKRASSSPLPPGEGRVREHGEGFSLAGASLFPLPSEGEGQGEGDAVSSSSAVPNPSSLKPEAFRGSSWPVVVNAHGGAMMAMSKEISTPICCELARGGVLVVNFSYRLAPRHAFPAPMEDMALALAWTREHAAEFGGDPDRIFLAGQSAGGLVAAWLGVALAKPELFDAVGIAPTVGPDGVRGMLLFYGVFDAETVAETSFPFVGLLPRALLGSNSTDRSRRAALASPRRHVTAGTPPAFLCCGEVDPLFSQSREMHDALHAAGARHETLFFPRDRHPEAGHAFVQFPRRRCGRMAVAKAIAFVRRHSASRDTPLRSLSPRERVG
jgi:acetyl esterase/lipase